MTEFKDLNSVLQNLIETATDDLPFMESARLRAEMVRELENATLCGIITAGQAGEILERVLLNDIERIEQRLEEIT